MVYWLYTAYIYELCISYLRIVSQPFPHPFRYADLESGNLQTIIPDLLFSGLPLKIWPRRHWQMTGQWEGMGAGLLSPGSSFVLLSQHQPSQSFLLWSLWWFEKQPCSPDPSGICTPASGRFSQVPNMSCTGRSVKNPSPSLTSPALVMLGVSYYF